MCLIIEIYINLLSSFILLITKCKIQGEPMPNFLLRTCIHTLNSGFDLGTRYNDRNKSGRWVRLGHLSTFIMPSFASNNLIHIVSNDFGQKGQKLKLPIEPRGVIVTWPISKKLKILDLLRLGQRRLGTPGMVLVDRKVVCIGPFWCLEVSGTV